MGITFDQIHTQKKQQRLSEMMHATTRKVLEIPNNAKVADTCPVCSSLEIKFYTYAFGFNMSRCTACELIFCNPYPNDVQLEYFYNSEFKQFENEFFRDSFEHRIELFKPRVEIIRKFKNSGSLLDVGSAIGIFIETLYRLEAPFKMNCCDLSKEACEEISGRYPGVNVINRNVLNLEEESKFDVITMWDTLEHIVDLNTIVNKIARLLETGGIFVFTTPNTHSFEWLTAGDKHVQILPPGHVNLLNIRPIKILLENAKLKIVENLTLNASLDISYIQRLIENGSVDISRLGVFMQTAIQDPEFNQLLEKYLINKRMAGNILVIAQKAL